MIKEKWRKHVLESRPGMYNREYGVIILPGYEAFLRTKGAVKDHHIPYYLKWVSLCYGFLNEPLGKRLDSDQRKKTIRRLSDILKDWQVRQADNALLHYDYFLSRHVSHEGAPSPWISREERVRSALGLRHRGRTGSLSTPCPPTSPRSPNKDHPVFSKSIPEK